LAQVKYALDAAGHYDDRETTALARARERYRKTGLTGLD
jgi:hypothetical protein